LRPPLLVLGPQRRCIRRSDRRRRSRRGLPLRLQVDREHQAGGDEAGTRRDRGKTILGKTILGKTILHFASSHCVLEIHIGNLSPGFSNRKSHSAQSTSVAARGPAGKTSAPVVPAKFWRLTSMLRD